MLALQLRTPSPLAQGSHRPQTQRRLVVRAADQQASSSAAAEPAAAAPKSVCGLCGVPLSEKPGGCNGEGRIMGGMGAVPGFGWWPIKAYRPCPKASEAGIAYTRKGQITDEVLFGKDK